MWGNKKILTSDIKKARQIPHVLAPNQSVFSNALNAHNIYISWVFSVVFFSWFWQLVEIQCRFPWGILQHRKGIYHPESDLFPVFQTEERITLWGWKPCSTDEGVGVGWFTTVTPPKAACLNFPQEGFITKWKRWWSWKKNECIASVVLYDQCRQVSHDGQLNSDQLK